MLFRSAGGTFFTWIDTGYLRADASCIRNIHLAGKFCRLRFTVLSLCTVICRRRILHRASLICPSFRSSSRYCRIYAAEIGCAAVCKASSARAVTVCSSTFRSILSVLRAVCSILIAVSSYSRHPTSQPTVFPFSSVCFRPCLTAERQDQHRTVPPSRLVRFRAAKPAPHSPHWIFPEKP